MSLCKIAELVQALEPLDGSKNMSVSRIESLIASSFKTELAIFQVRRERQRFFQNHQITERLQFEYF